MDDGRRVLVLPAERVAQLRAALKLEGVDVSLEEYAGVDEIVDGVELPRPLPDPPEYTYGKIPASFDNMPKMMWLDEFTHTFEGLGIKELMAAANYEIWEATPTYYVKAVPLPMSRATLIAKGLLNPPKPKALTPRAQRKGWRP